jgi:hypothetical protein
LASPNLNLLPHTGGSTEDAQLLISILVPQNLLKYINNNTFPYTRCLLLPYCEQYVFYFAYSRFCSCLYAHNLGVFFFFFLKKKTILDFNTRENKYKQC